jgi:hypothetical protein
MVCAAAVAWAEAQMLAPRYAHTATPLADGRVLIYGGLGPGDGFMLGTEILDPATGESVSGPYNHRCRAFHTATALPDGTVLVAGGFVLPYSSSRSAELLESGRFVFLESKMSAPRELHTATLLADGRVLIAGGFVGGVTSLAGCDLYDPLSRAFKPTGDMHFSRFGHAACRLEDGRVLITGGTQYPGEKTLAAAELYEPDGGRFRPAGSMLADRTRHTGTVLPDGRVLITGGYSASAGRQLASTELLDPATGAFTSGPDMAEPRMDHTATLLADGRVLISGGFNAEGRPHTVASCEVFDPEEGRFLPAGSLPAAVHEHKATLLPSGAVLVSGGLRVEGEAREALAQADVITP